MYNPYNPEANTSLIKSFKNFLLTQKISKGSIRSYLSDVRHFIDWLSEFLKKYHALETSQGISLLNQVNQKLLETYRNYLTDNHVPPKTINRRFSSLRKFGSFCEEHKWLSENPFDTLKNVSPNQPFPEDEHHLKEFRIYLWQKGSSKVTVKNYLNDTKQFLLWKNKLV